VAWQNAKDANDVAFNARFVPAHSYPFEMKPQGMSDRAAPRLRRSSTASRVKVGPFTCGNNDLSEIHGARTDD